MFVFLQALMAGPNTHDGTFIHLQGLTPTCQLIEGSSSGETGRETKAGIWRRLRSMKGWQG
jgi:hypothetical protein